ncbi:hypothetical protein AXX17_AT4G25190 [Arabidopsis thaliana]|uniref:Vesicle-fusing ATPase n=1 Tax=Arabidopsis thaliana TaxID=3702 RepID=A0A178UT92_ARATH|nr:hypothetical protein AXX17_AT4G25190 [Arabidopsis thaliana]
MMADFSDSFVMKMTVKTTPESDLALTNLAYCSPFDLHRFAVPETADLFLANVGEVFVLSISYPFFIHLRF